MIAASAVVFGVVFIVVGEVLDWVESRRMSIRSMDYRTWIRGIEEPNDDDKEAS